MGQQLVLCLVFSHYDNKRRNCLKINDKKHSSLFNNALQEHVRSHQTARVAKQLKAGLVKDCSYLKF